MHMQNTAKSFSFRILCGFFLGISVIAPGVSGSIMAVMMGVYPKLISIISNPFKRFKENFFYLLPMGIGALLSLVLLVKVLAYSFERYPMQSQLLFMGLIAGSIIEVIHQTRRVKFKTHYILGIAATFAIALTMGLMEGSAASSGAVDPTFWYLCIVGFAAGITSIIPGMSVSLLLMLFGVYDYLLQTATGLFSDFWHTVSVAMPVGVCFLIGLVLFSNLVKLVFNRFPGFAYCMVLGFICGTLIAVFPSSLPGSPVEWLACILLFIVGLSVSVGFQRLGKKLNSDPPETSG